MKIKLDGGKYVWSFDEQTGRQEAYRFGELWRDLNGDNLTLAMGHRIEALEAALVETIEWMRTREDFKVSAAEAIKQIEELLK